MSEEIDVFEAPLMNDVKFLDALAESWAARGAAIADQVTLRETSQDRPDGTFELCREVSIRNPSRETLRAALRLWS